jgi:hypothetical protein
MASIGGDMLLEEFKGSALAVAEALLLGKLESYEIDRVNEVVSPLVLQAAKIRLEAMGKLNAENIKPAPKRQRS